MQCFAHAHQHRSRLGLRPILTIHTPTVHTLAGACCCPRSSCESSRAVPTQLRGSAASAAPPTHLPTHPASAAAHPAHRTCLPDDENPTRA